MPYLGIDYSTTGKNENKNIQVLIFFLTMAAIGLVGENRHVSLRIRTAGETRGVL